MPPDIEKLQQKLCDLHAKASAIEDRLTAENREPTAEERAELIDLQDQFDSTSARLTFLTADNNAGQMSQSRGRQSEPSQLGTRDPAPVNVNTPTRGANKKGFIVGFTPSGEEILAYRNTEKISDVEISPDALGSYVAAILTNDKSRLHRDIRNQVTTGSDADGGVFAPPALSGMFIDLARDASVCMKAGAVTTNVPGSSLEIGKLTSDITASWRQETASITASQPAFGKIRLIPKVLAALVPISVEWLEDVANGQALITSAITSAMASEMDRAALKGGGAGAEPTGVVNASGVNSQSNVGTPTTYSQITTAVRDILVDNYDGDIEALSWIYNPLNAATYQGLVTGISSDNTPLLPPEWVSKLQRYTTNSLAANTTSPITYDMVVGDFMQMLWGLRSTGMQIEVLSSGSASDASGNSFNAATEMYRFVRVYIRMDVALTRADWFSVLSGVTL